MVPVRVVAKPRDIVGERVQPHVHDVFFVKVHGHAPSEGYAGNAKILQAFQKEIVHHFVLSRYGLNELGVCVDMLDQTVGVFAHFEKVRFFLGGLYFPATVGAFAVHELTFRPKRLAGRAIHTFIVALVNIPLVVEFFKNLRHLFHVIRIGGAHKFIV